MTPEEIIRRLREIATWYDVDTLYDVEASDAAADLRRAAGVLESSLAREAKLRKALIYWQIAHKSGRFETCQIAYESAEQALAETEAQDEPASSAP